MNLLTDKQVAEILGLKPRYVREHLDKDPTFPRKIRLSPRNIRYQREDVERWINQRKEPEIG